MTPGHWLPTLALSALALLASHTCAQTPSQAEPSPVTLGVNAAAPPPQATRDDPAAAALIRDAIHLEQQHSYTAARLKLDEAKAINPLQPSLWSSYGLLAMQEGKPAEAVENYQHEIAGHPGQPNTYRLLAQAQVQQQKPKDAIETLQKLVALAPNDANATSFLVSLYFDGKDYAAAEDILRKVLAAHPGSQTELFLSAALLHTGKKEEATKLLSAIAEKSEDPGLLNDAAYSLADDNLDVPLAERAARRAIAMLDQQSIDAATEPKPLVRAEMFASVWDTLGWALFREGKAAEAEPWVRASWSHALSAEPGYHLGVILEKLNQPAKAMAVYQLALFGDRGSNADTVAEANLARQAALRKAGTPNPVTDGKIALQNLRTFKVPGANSLNGWATVELELSADGPSNAAIIKDDPDQDRLTPVETSLYLINYKTTLPPASRAHIVRRGILSCHAGKPCEFVLFSTAAALSDPN